MLAMFHLHSVLPFSPRFHADKIICLILFLKKLFPFFNLDVKTCVDLVKFFFIKTKQGSFFFLACFLSFPMHFLNTGNLDASYMLPLLSFVSTYPASINKCHSGPDVPVHWEIGIFVPSLISEDKGQKLPPVNT